MKLNWNRWTKIFAAALAGLIAVEIAWLTLAQSYLRSPHFRSSLQHAHWQIHFDTIRSPFPTSLEISKLSISVSQKNVHWQLEFDQARLHLRLLPLFWRHLSFASIQGQGGQLSLQTQTEAEEGPAAPSALDEAKSRGQTSKWDLSISELSVEDLRSLRVGDLRVEGQSNFAVGLSIDPDRRVNLNEGRFSVTQAAFFKDNAQLGTLSKSQLSFDLQGLTPEQTLPEIIGNLRSKLSIDAQLLDTGLLYNWLAQVKWLKLEGKGARIAGDLAIAQSEFQAGSELSISAGPTQALFLKQKVSGTAHSSWKVDDDGLVQIEVVFDSYALQRLQEAKAEVKGHNLRLYLSSPKPKLGRDFEHWQAEIKMPPAEISNMAFINAYFPAGTGFAFESGQGRLEAHIEANSDAVQKSGGFIRFNSDQLQLRYEQTLLAAKVRADMNFAALDLTQSSFQLKQSFIALDQVKLRNDPESKDWSGRLEIPSGKIQLEEPVSFQGKVLLQGQDVRPLLALYSKKGSLPAWSIDLLNVKDLKVTFQAKADAELLAIENLEASAERIRMQGWFKLLRKVPKGQLLLHYGGFSGGLRVEGQDYQFKLFPDPKWLMPDI